MVAHDLIPTLGGRGRQIFWFLSKSALHSEFQNSQDYTEKLSWKPNKKGNIEKGKKIIALLQTPKTKLQYTYFTYSTFTVHDL